MITINDNTNKKSYEDIVITRGYINTYEDFVNKVKEEYGIEDYNKEINSLYKLSSVIIIKNYLSTIEANRVFQSFTHSALGSIQRINLTANNLDAIPLSFEGLTGLKTLILNNNKIKSIDHMSTMIQLERLELRGNQIEKIEGLNSLKELKLLTLSNNQIKSIAKDDIPELSNLIDLGLFGNYIGDASNDNNNAAIIIELCSCIGIKMINLKNIYLGGNYFSTIKNSALIAKESIKSLEKYDGHNITQ